MDAKRACEKEMTDAECLKFHGLMGRKEWELPKRVVQCDMINRKGYNGTESHEYLDHKSVLKAKVKLLAELVRQSKNMVAYTGAGISTAAGIGDYATQSSKSLVHKGKKKHTGSRVLCEPTLAHYVLARMGQEGMLKKWVNQNHDGLPQKAGMPGHLVNDIHGSWFDPSYPVVQFSESLRDDLFEDLLHWEKATDLCLTMGSSLCGMNADRMVESSARRYAKRKKGYGSVIVNLQATPYDNVCSIRIFAKIDDVAKLLAKELRISYSLGPMYVPDVPKTDLANHVFMVPYDEHGRLCKEKGKLRQLDLSEGAKVMVTGGKFEGCKGEVHAVNPQGNYRLRVLVPVKKDFEAYTALLLGTWWIEAAVKGTTPILPVVSVTD